MCNLHQISTQCTHTEQRPQQRLVQEHGEQQSPRRMNLTHTSYTPYTHTQMGQCSALGLPTTAFNPHPHPHPAACYCYMSEPFTTLENCYTPLQAFMHSTPVEVAPSSKKAEKHQSCARNDPQVPPSPRSRHNVPPRLAPTELKNTKQSYVPPQWVHLTVGPHHPPLGSHSTPKMDLHCSVHPNQNAKQCCTP